MKVVNMEMDIDAPFTGCWNLEVDRGSLGKGIGDYRSWAAGDGKLVRHLCSNSRCINPLHLVRGYDKENGEDEVRKRYVIGKNIFDECMKNEKFVYWIDKFMAQVGRYRCSVNVGWNEVEFAFKQSCNISSNEFKMRMDRNYSIVVSNEVYERFSSNSWSEIFSCQVKRALSLWEIISRTRRVVIVRKYNVMNWGIEDNIYV